MKKITFIFLALLSTSGTFAQDIISQKLDDYFNITTKKKYVYTRELNKEGAIWKSNDYDKKGNLVQSQYFLDAACKQKTGYYVFFEKNKKIYEGNYINNKPVGTWYFYEPLGVLSDSLMYYNKTAEIPALPPPGISKKDNSKIVTNNITKDTMQVFNVVETEAAFPGGDKAWKRFLEKHLLPKDGVHTSVPANRYPVQVMFIVCTDGSICNVETANSTHPLIDWYAIKTIKKVPTWQPAIQNGRNVRAYRRQPITFEVFTE